MHLFGTICLLIFSKKSHLYVYSHLYFNHFCQIHYVSNWHMKQRKGFWGMLRVAFIMYGSKMDKLSLYFLYVCNYSNHVKTISYFCQNDPPIRLFIFQKSSHLYVYSVLYFYCFSRKFPTYTFIRNRCLFGTLEYMVLIFEKISYLYVYSVLYVY